MRGKRKAVLTLLNDHEWCKWSDREIGRRCGVDHMVVGRLRPVEPSGAQRQIPPKRKVRRKGKVYEQDTSGINAGREPADEPADDEAEDEPEAASPEYDSAAGYLRQKLVETIERIDAWPSVEDAMVAWMAGRQRGPSIEMVQHAAEFADLCRKMEPLRRERADAMLRRAMKMVNGAH